MRLAEYVACICEGGAEETIINILLDNNCLIFSREQLLEEKPLREKKEVALKKSTCVKILKE